MQNHNGHPLARSTSLVSSLDLVSSPEAELGKRRRLADGKRHRRMESAPVRGRRRKIFRSILEKWKRAPAGLKIATRTPYTRGDPV